MTLVPPAGHCVQPLASPQKVEENDKEHEAPTWPKNAPDSNSDWATWNLCQILLWSMGHCWHENILFLFFLQPRSNPFAPLVAKNVANQCVQICTYLKKWVKVTSIKVHCDIPGLISTSLTGTKKVLLYHSNCFLCLRGEECKVAFSGIYLRIICTLPLLRQPPTNSDMYGTQLCYFRCPACIISGGDDWGLS